MKILNVIVLFFQPFIFLAAQDLQFYKEDLSFTLNDSSFRVDGLYYFCNTDSKQFINEIYYPFPIDSIYYGQIDSIIVESDNKSLPYRKNKGGIFIPFRLEPYKSNIYHIAYSQKILKNKAEYILTSTQTWNRALESVSYKLTIASDIQIKSFNYKPDSSFIENGTLHYSWKMKDFYPIKNMVFEFEK